MNQSNPKKQSQSSSDSKGKYPMVLNQELNGSQLKYKQITWISKSLQMEQSNSRFTDKEFSLLKRRFDKLATKGVLSRIAFRDSLGLLGLEHATFLSDRLFNIIDFSGDGHIDFQEFMQYLAVVLHGSADEKALMSFNFLDIRRQKKLLYQDFEQLMFDICIFWNIVTGGKVIPQKEKIQKIWFILANTDNELTFENYQTNYDDLVSALNWFKFFNQDDPAKRIQQKLDLAQRMIDEEHQNSQNRNLIDNTIDLIDHQVHDCILTFRNYETSKVLNMTNNTQQISSNQSSKIFNMMKDQNQFHGPCFVDLPTQSKVGDLDPQMGHSTYNQQRLTVNQRRETNQAVLKNLNVTITSDDHLDHLQAQFESLQIAVQNCIDETTQHKLNENKHDSNRNKKDNAIRAHADSMRRRQTTKIIQPLTSDGEEKRNISIYFGHENWNLVLNMMIGMRKSVKMIPPYINMQSEDEQEFQTKMLHDILPSRTQNFDYRLVYHFIDYRPYIFSRIRAMYGVTNIEYQQSIGPENMLGNLVLGRLNSLSELCSSGKSGSFFYFTEDSKYMIKTISVLEAKFFKRILRNYYTHLKLNPQTLISRIFGFYKMKIFKSKTKSKKVYLIVMCNLFLTGLEIDFRYDIKGSLYGRRTRKNNEPVNPGEALKDQDMLSDKNYLKMNQTQRKLFDEQVVNHIHCQIIQDGRFFRENKIIDYSLLIGFHKRKQGINSIKHLQERRAQYGQDKRDPQYFRFNETQEGGLLSKDETIIYYFGIIDILTEFGTKKKWEHSLKTTFVSDDVSCIPPLPYSQRFEEFIQKSVLPPRVFEQF